MRTGGVLALVLGLAALLPSSAMAAGDSLQLVGQPQVDRAGSLFPDDWVVTASSAVFDQPGYRADFSWNIPAAIPPSGADVTLTVTATDKSGGGLTTGLGLHGNVPFTGGDGTVYASANKNAGRPTATGSKTFRLTPGSYCDACPITVMIGLQSGPRVTFTYKVVPKPKGKPCPGGSVARLAQLERPLLCLMGEPAPGKARTISSPALGGKVKKVTVDVASSAGGLSGTTIVGAGEARKASADRIGEAVAACYLLGADVFDYPTETIDGALRRLLGSKKIRPVDIFGYDRPAHRLKICIALARELVDGPSVSGHARATATGCRTKRIALSPRVRRGKVVGLKLSRSQRLFGTSVRYGCTGSRSGAKLTVKRAQGLRAAVGKKLGLGIVRSPGALASGATLSFRFR
jgi:hypothetical protein